MDAGMETEGLSAVAGDAGAALAEREIRADRLPRTQLLLGAEVDEAAANARRGRSRATPDVRAPRHSTERAEAALGRRRRRDLRFGVGGHDDEGGAVEARHHLHVARRGAS